MIVLKRVDIEINGYITSVDVVCNSDLPLKNYENRIKDTYYGGRKGWRKTDTFRILKGTIIKDKLGL